MQFISNLYKAENIDDNIGMILWSICLIYPIVFVLHTYINEKAVRKSTEILFSLIIILLLIFGTGRLVVGAYGIIDAFLPTEETEHQMVKTPSEVLSETVEETNIKYISMNTKYTTNQNGIVICDIYGIEGPEEELTAEDFVFEQGLEAVIQLSKADEGTHYILTLQQVKGKEGTYKISIKDTTWAISVTITPEEVSNDVKLTCTASDTKIEDKGSVTLTLSYSGASVNNNTCTYQVNDTCIKLSNCTGNINITKGSTGNYYVAISDVSVIDRTKQVYVEVLSGSVLDSKGLKCNSEKCFLEVG